MYALVAGASSRDVHQAEMRMSISRSCRAFGTACPGQNQDCIGASLDRSGLRVIRNTKVTLFTPHIIVCPLESLFTWLPSPTLFSYQLWHCHLLS